MHPHDNGTSPPAKRTDVLPDHYQRYRSLSLYEFGALYYAVGVKHEATVSYQLEQMGGNIAGLGPASWMERLAFQTDWLSDRAKKVWGDSLPGSRQEFQASGRTLGTTRERKTTHPRLSRYIGVRWRIDLDLK